MEGIQTGGKNGDGTVFSLDLHEVRFELANTRLQRRSLIGPRLSTTQNLIFAGLRRGAMRIYDRRASHPKKRNRDDESQSRNDVRSSVRLDLADRY